MRNIYQLHDVSRQYSHDLTTFLRIAHEQRITREFLGILCRKHIVLDHERDPGLGSDIRQSCHPADERFDTFFAIKQAPTGYSLPQLVHLGIEQESGVETVAIATKHSTPFERQFDMGDASLTHLRIERTEIENERIFRRREVVVNLEVDSRRQSLQVVQ